jgi:hypothetical protein
MAIRQGEPTSIVGLREVHVSSVDVSSTVARHGTAGADRTTVRAGTRVGRDP